MHGSGGCAWQGACMSGGLAWQGGGVRGEGACMAGGSLKFSSCTTLYLDFDDLRGINRV